MAAHPLIGEWREAFQLFDKSGNGKSKNRRLYFAFNGARNIR
jgi:Ca2+-binding EF-hand superfamily protein